MEEYRIDPTIAYDVVELPSRGIYYKNKKKSLKVSFLTAADENILSSNSLLVSGTMTNELLKRKILDRDLSIDELVEEDKQAILIFLRNTAFGTEYSIVTTDPKTSQSFTVDVDLSTLKVKEFILQEDSNGEYSFFMNKSQVDITFSFLTVKQLKELDDLEKNWNGIGAAPVITKQLEFMIKSVAGNKDIMNIHNFVENLPIKDSQEFRKFVMTNKPGLDLTQTITTPSGDTIQVEIGFGVEFFRPFYGI
jgi:hypothetical protein